MLTAPRSPSTGSGNDVAEVVREPRPKLRGWVHTGMAPIALAAGIVLLPVTLIMLVLSSVFGGLAGRKGPRFFMAAGPVVAGVGYLLMITVGNPPQLLTQLFPGLLLFGVGLAMTVAPLTSAILGDISHEHAGIGSAINNAVSRVAGLVAIAFAGVITGGVLDLAGFHRLLIWTAGSLIISGALSAVGISNRRTLERAATGDAAGRDGARDDQT